VLTEPDSPGSLTELLGQTFQKYPAANIVVTTTSATWKRTREALLAGAMDYFRQTLDPDSLRNYLNPTLDKYLPKNH
jgi:DNA-binding NtrC family response regulator